VAILFFAIAIILDNSEIIISQPGDRIRASFPVRRRFNSMLPRVIMYNAVSVDGWIENIHPDLGQYYAAASRFEEDATLAGCDTLLAAVPGEDINKEGEAALEPPWVKPEDQRPLLVVPDSRGRLRSWHMLLSEGIWRGGVALVSDTTQREYLDYLEKQQVDYIVTGDDRVNLREALEELRARYGVKTVRTDSGGTLNGVLLREELVDEIGIYIEPCLVGGMSPHTIFRALEPESEEDVIQLRLKSLEHLENDVALLHYEVIK
jgi:2,5-diamino-6-(ribosylamino)-4(3H)-pyrimidinone 5'-phosphate reductase